MRRSPPTAVSLSSDENYVTIKSPIEEPLQIVYTFATACTLRPKWNSQKKYV
jgi:hypothetical protein